MDLPDQDNVFLISEFGILDGGDISELAKTLAKSEEVPPAFIEQLLTEQPGTLIEVPIYIPKKGVMTNKNYKYALFCLTKNYHRKSNRYLVVNPKISNQVVRNFDYA